MTLAIKHKAKPVRHKSVAPKRGTPEISPDAMLAWGRIPSSYKVEILDAVKHASAEGKTQSLKVGKKVLTIGKSSSGFRVVFEAGQDRDTIVSVITPREARLLRD